MAIFGWVCVCVLAVALSYGCWDMLTVLWSMHYRGLTLLRSIGPGWLWLGLACILWYVAWAYIPFGIIIYW